MSELCRWLHEKLEQLPLFRFPFKVDELPENGIYFFYEQDEKWGHGGDKPRIVRIGTHREGNFRSRIAEHYLLNELKMNFTEKKSKPSDRSIFRKNIGRAFLNRHNDKYLHIWEIDFTNKKNRENFKHLRNIGKEIEIEAEITALLRRNFSFRCFEFWGQSERIGATGLESSLIGTVNHCKICSPSSKWLGNYSPIRKIAESGLWQVQHLMSNGINQRAQKTISEAIERML